jgi:hypothetical protein
MSLVDMVHRAEKIEIIQKKFKNHYICVATIKIVKNLMNLYIIDL